MPPTARGRAASAGTPLAGSRCAGGDAGCDRLPLTPRLPCGSPAEHRYGLLLGTSGSQGRASLFGPASGCLGEARGCSGGVSGCLGGARRYLRGARGYLGGAWGFLGRVPGSLGGAWGFLGGAPGYLRGAWGFLGGAPGYLRGAWGSLGGTRGYFGGASGDLGEAWGNLVGATDPLQEPAPRSTDASPVPHHLKSGCDAKRDDLSRPGGRPAGRRGFFIGTRISL